jgi:hypothetical protein
MALSLQPRASTLSWRLMQDSTRLNEAFVFEMLRWN